MTFYCVYLTERRVELHWLGNCVDQPLLQERIVSTHRDYSGAYAFAVDLGKLKQLPLVQCDLSKSYGIL